ncbi:MAG: efflux RND transporter periplasmic adaptor subunit [Candidatus Algichlamydia australiensis]|nr:efflux RND transporter periplasmic adaptor subunit [Chlamydiales bacterium]
MRKNKFLILVLVFGFAACSKKEAKVKPPPSVNVVEVIQKDVPLYLQAPGHITAFNSVSLQAQVDGTVTGVYYEEGKEVSEGELLVTIDDRTYEAAVKASEAEVARSMATLKYNQDTARRNTPLVQEDYISQNDYDNLVTNVLTSEATVKDNLARLDQANIDLGYCRVEAPMTGVAGERLIDEGNLVLEAQQTTLVTINQIQPIYCDFAISERYFSMLHEIMKEKTLQAQVSYTRDFKESWYGDITFMDNAVDQTTGMIKFKANFPNDDKKLWPNIFIYTRLIYGEAKNALLLPTGCIVIGEKGKYIYVLDGDIVKQVYVTTGQQEGDLIIIKTGLKPDQKVVLEGQLNLLDGEKVTVKQVVKNKEEAGI